MAAQLNPFEILADPTRREILEALRSGERPVNDIVAAVAIHQSGVSRHLRILNESGFVNVRAVGPQRFYSLRVGFYSGSSTDGWADTARCGKRGSTASPRHSREKQQVCPSGTQGFPEQAAKAPEKKR